MGSALLFIFTSSIEPPIYIPTHNTFQWKPYEDPVILEVILEEFFTIRGSVNTGSNSGRILSKSEHLAC
ncbi:hypothetical protein PVK06_048242 [Gossypium arboreum]|uniref:Uncharacterized protein n=1 Tax=Gossypium arboreum TaxID=29729 RepID=A0ABR0MFJ2_GOSAR|nr:hypothetical protein PVK06_048242 [Gossypium arboreum]